MQKIRGEKKSSGFQKGRNPIISYNDNFRARRNGEKFASRSFRAEEEIFSESALVQIAGRAGRSFEVPYGEVIYFHYGKTEAMVRAKNIFKV